MKSNTITEENIVCLIRDFYAKRRKDDQLGPIFAASIGSSDEEWKHHMQRMVDF